MSWDLKMEGRLPASMNSRERTSHWVRRRELNDITTELGYLALELGMPPATGRRRVTVTIHKSTRSRVTDDPANRDSRAKACLDALVNLGYLRGDSDAWLEWGGVLEGERRRIKSTVVEIRECP